MHSEKLIVELSIYQGISGHSELAAHQHRHDAANQKEHSSGNDKALAHGGVVDGRERAPPRQIGPDGHQPIMQAQVMASGRRSGRSMFNGCAAHGFASAELCCWASSHEAKSSAEWAWSSKVIWACA